MHAFLGQKMQSCNLNIQSYPISETTIGYIFQRKRSHKKVQKIECHHAACILPRGEIVSYGYDIVAAAMNGNWFQQKLEKGFDGIIKSSSTATLPSRYMDFKKAISKGLPPASLILIEVSRLKASQFEMFWNSITKKYDKISHNCSTACYDAF